MVLCAGLGTRLRPLTDELPKPLVPVGDRSVLAHIAARLSAAGFSRAVVNTHHLAEKFNSDIGSLELKVELIHEPVIRGTAGGLCGGRVLLGSDPVLVWNGDIVADPPIDQMLGHAASGGLCLAVAPRPQGAGTVGLSESGSVVRLRGESFGEETQGGDYVGIAALGSEALSRLPEIGCLIGDVALPWLRRGATVATAALDGAWTDLGDPASYHLANMLWLEHEVPTGVHLGPGTRIDPGVILERCIIGHGAIVQGHGRVCNLVAWPNARLRAPLRDAIVTTSGRVVGVNAD
jgi:mannose-1-phosphate guanylyltransferase